MTHATEIAHTAVGILGNVVSFILFVSPIPTFWRIYNNKSVEGLEYLHYVASIINCIFWILYGAPSITPNAILVVTINGVGLVMEVIYTLIYFIYADNEKRFKITLCILLELIIIGAVAGATLGAVHTIEERSAFAGAWVILSSILVNQASLVGLVNVIETKSVASMSILFIITDFCSRLIWISYALLRFDHTILASNGLGSVTDLIQLIIYACYYKTTPRGVSPEPEQIQVELPAAGPDVV